MFSWSIFLGESTSRSCGSFWRDYGGSSWGEARYMIAIQAIFRPTFPPHRGAHGDREQPLQVWPSCCSSGWSWSCTRVEAPLPESVYPTCAVCSTANCHSLTLAEQIGNFCCVSNPEGSNMLILRQMTETFTTLIFRVAFKEEAHLQMAKWGEGDPR